MKKTAIPTSGSIPPKAPPGRCAVIAQMKIKLHWQLCIVSRRQVPCSLKPRGCQIGHPYTFRFTLKMIKANKTVKLGIKNKHLLAEWNLNYCELALGGQHLPKRFLWSISLLLKLSVLKWKTLTLPTQMYGPKFGFLFYKNPINLPKVMVAGPSIKS